MHIEAPPHLKVADANGSLCGAQALGRAGAREAKILIVDDETNLTEVLLLVLEHGGYRRIESTTDARSAVYLAGHFQPDLIVLDLSMPGLNGLDVLAELRASGTAMPILVVSGDSASETQLEALRGGASDFLAKPYQVNEILARIGNLLAPRFSAEHPSLAIPGGSPSAAEWSGAPGVRRGFPAETFPHFARRSGHPARSLGAGE